VRRFFFFFLFCVPLNTEGAKLYSDTVIITTRMGGLSTVKNKKMKKEKNEKLLAREGMAFNRRSFERNYYIALLFL